MIRQLKLLNDVLFQKNFSLCFSLKFYDFYIFCFCFYLNVETNNFFFWLRNVYELTSVFNFLKISEKINRYKINMTNIYKEIESLWQIQKNSIWECNVVYVNYVVFWSLWFVKKRINKNVLFNYALSVGFFLFLIMVKIMF